MRPPVNGQHKCVYTCSTTNCGLAGWHTPKQLHALGPPLAQLHPDSGVCCLSALFGFLIAGFLSATQQTASCSRFTAASWSMCAMTHGVSRAGHAGMMGQLPCCRYCTSHSTNATA